MRHKPKKIIADRIPKLEIWYLKRNKFFGDTVQGTITYTNRFTGGQLIITLVAFVSGKTGAVFFQNKQDDYSQPNSPNDSGYFVSLTTTSCNYGGYRYWFICPLSVNGRHCGKRVGVLYHYGGHFGCRHCFKLTYKSRNLGGVKKKYGRPMTIQEFEDIEDRIKGRTHYKGVITKKYARLLYRKQRSELVWEMGIQKLKEKIGARNIIS